MSRAWVNLAIERQAELPSALLELANLAHRSDYELIDLSTIFGLDAAHDVAAEGHGRMEDVQRDLEALLACYPFVSPTADRP